VTEFLMVLALKNVREKIIKKQKKEKWNQEKITKNNFYKLKKFYRVI
jgi:hypothetical protein